MFDRPSLAVTISYVTLPNLAAFALVQLAGVDALGYLCVLFVGLGSWWVGIVHLQGQLEDYKRVNGVGSPASVQPEQRRTLLDLNTGNVMYPFQASALKIDIMTSRMKRFSRTLITQRENGFKVDLREKTWEGQFGGRKNYVYVRDVRMAGAFAKENPELTNSPFGVVDWRIVEEGAKGKV